MCACNTPCNCDETPTYPESDNPECKDSMEAQCIFWTSDPIPELGITKGMRMTEVVIKIAAAIKTLQLA